MLKWSYALGGRAPEFMANFCMF